MHTGPCNACTHGHDMHTGPYKCTQGRACAHALRRERVGSGRIGLFDRALQARRSGAAFRRSVTEDGARGGHDLGGPRLPFAQRHLVDARVHLGSVDGSEATRVTPAARLTAGRMHGRSVRRCARGRPIGHALGPPVAGRAATGGAGARDAAGAAALAAVEAPARPEVELPICAPLCRNTALIVAGRWPVVAGVAWITLAAATSVATAAATAVERESTAALACSAEKDASAEKMRRRNSRRKQSEHTCRAHRVSTEQQGNWAKRVHFAEA